ncbi:MAG: aminotransferase class V-fold PLP-dependent enzyme [Acidobacteriota bacterium]
MKELIYIDNSATLFPKPKEILDFMDNFYRHYGVNPGRSGYDLCMEAEQMVQETRKLLTEFFYESNAERLVIIYNAFNCLHGL